MRLLDTVGSRVMALIVSTTLPLATIASVLAWHSYIVATENSATRIINAAHRAKIDVQQDIGRSQISLEMFSDMGLSSSNIDHIARLLQSVSLNHYCSIALIDRNGKTLSSFSDITKSTIQCGGVSFPLSAGDKWRSISVVPKHQTVRLLAAGNMPLIQVISPTSYTNAEGQPASGALVVVKILSLTAQSWDTRNAQFAIEANDAAAIWLVGSDKNPLLLFHSGDAPTPWPQNIIKRLTDDRERNSIEDHFRDGNTYYAIVPVSNGINLIASSQRTASENYALHVFVARLLLIVSLLAIELLLVAFAAHSYLVDPLERLALSVAEWRRHNVFEPELPKAIPLEIRHLERAFRRATARLTRHETRLRRAAKQQDVLIREIHHRVKNNLQIVASLLNLQANRISEPEAQKEFRLVRDRVRTLATLHRYLYPAGGVANLDIKAFLTELCSQIFLSYGQATNGRIKLVTRIEAVSISPDQAVPVSLIVGEVINNALRFAFPDEREGEISVSLTMQDTHCTLEITDNGIGMAQMSKNNGMPPRTKGIGLQLITGFARQINAKLDIRKDNGTSYRLTFEPAPPRKPAEGVRSLTETKNTIPRQVGPED